MQIQTNSLRSFIHQTWIYFQAKDSFYTGNIRDISIDFVDDEYQIEVSFEDRRRLLIEKMTVNQYGLITDARCSCKNNRQGVGCIHLIAAVEAINEIEPTTFPFVINYQAYLKEKRHQEELEIARANIEHTNIELLSLLDTVQNEKIARLISSKEDPIHIHIDLENNRSYGLFELGFMIGTNKMYRVKDIRRIVQGFSKNDIYPLGKSQTIQLKRDNLDESSLKILDFLSNYALVEDWRRTALIEGYMLDDVYNLLSSLPADYYNFYLFDHKFRFPVKLNKEDEYYLLEADEERLEDLGTLFLSKKNLYTFESREFHRYHFDEDGQVGKLVNFMYQNDNVYIKSENMKDFYLRMLEPNLKYLDIQSNFDLSLFSSYVSDIRIYSDLEDSQLRIWGSYNVDSVLKKLFEPCNLPEILSIEAIIKNYANTVKDEVAYFKSRGSRVNNFLDIGLPLLMQQAKVYVSEELMQLKNRRSLDLSIGIKINNNLLEMNIDSKDISRDELIHILNAYRKKKKFYQLKNGQTIDLEEDSIRKLDDFATQLNLQTKDFKEELIKKPAYQALHLEDVEAKIHSDESINTYTKKLEKIQKGVFTYPEKYTDLLREYQKEGIEWIHHLNQMGLNGILADDMGLGKTIQVLVYLENYVHSNLPSLIVCPSSLMYNWEGEIKKFNIEIDAACVNGVQDERNKTINEKHQLYITTYDYLKRDIELYKEKKFEYIILDEAQYIKNPKTQNAQCVKQLDGKHKLALTGTPIENSLSELWSIFDFLLPGYLYSLSFFVKNYEKPIRQEHDETRQAILKKLVQPFILRRTKAQVLSDLPEKVEKEMWLDFSKREKNLYVANLAKVNEELQEQLKLEHVDSILILSLMTRLRQICCDARMLYDEIKEESTKMSVCLDLIETLKENNKKVLLFSSFTTIFDSMIKAFDQRGIHYHLLTGKTSKEKRLEEVEAFQKDDSDVFLISLKAGGTGLNLTSAQAVIHFDPWWNVSAQNQATDRAYRIGQTKNVLVYQLLVKNTIEEKIFEMQKNKKEMSDIFVENSNGGISSLTKEELKDLFTLK